MSTDPSERRDSSISTSATVSLNWQNKLQGECIRLGLTDPRYEMFSDRRGGRTAWSSTVEVDGKQFQARYWYDGNFANNAKEDAAEVALQGLGLIPTPRNPYRQAPGQGSPR